MSVAITCAMIEAVHCKFTHVSEIKIVCCVGSVEMKIKIYKAGKLPINRKRSLTF